MPDSPSVSHSERKHPPTRRRLRRLAWLLDSSIPLPVVGYRVGLDALLGLLPGIGDAIGAGVSSYILAEAVRFGVPRAMLVKMGYNIAVEAVLGTVPGVGDLFDAGWKANERNVALLEEHLDDPQEAASEGRVLTVALGAGLVVLVLGVATLGALALRVGWQLATG